jgi:hypothetical protein
MLAKAHTGSFAYCTWNHTVQYSTVMVPGSSGIRASSTITMGFAVVTRPSTKQRLALKNRQKNGAKGKNSWSFSPLNNDKYEEADIGSGL